jgi:hypothetical protein
MQRTVKTKDNKEIQLNIKRAIMIKETNEKKDLLDIINMSKVPKILPPKLRDQSTFRDILNVFETCILS